MTAQEILQQLNELDEHSRIEAKTASEIGQSLMETICAYANEPGLGGGHIILGVAFAEDSLFPSYEVVGLQAPDKLQSEIGTQCATMFNRPLRPMVRTEPLFGHLVITIFVQEAEATDKPIFFKSVGLPKGAYRRIGSTDQRCSEDDLRVFYQGHQLASYDEQLIADATLDDIDAEAVKFYRTARVAANPAAEELRWTQEELLRAVTAVKASDGTWKPTAAGILRFGSSMALRRCFPMMRVDYIRVPGREWVANPDRRFDTVEIRAPLVRALQRAYTAIVEDLPKAFQLESGSLQRKDIPAVPERVIREALVNALMHRSYRDHGPVQIIRYANRLEIRNPGHSLIAEERLGEPGSETRNPKIAAVLHDLGFAENKGSGIRVMREQMIQANLSPPYLESDRTGNRFIVILLFHHFLAEEDLEWMKNFRDDNLTPEEVKALVFLREAGAINNSAYRDLNRGVDTLEASRHLRRLCKVGLLEKKSTGADTYYVGTNRLLGPLRKLPKPSESVAKPSESVAKPSESMTKPSESVTKPSKSAGVPTLPESLKKELEQLGGRATQAVMRRTIQNLCRWQPLSGAVIAGYLQRGEVHVRQTYLTPMIASGELQYVYPNEPNHPQQAYRTVERAETPT